MAVNQRGIFVLPALVGTIQRLVQTAGMIVVTPLVLDALGQDQFGIWGAVTSLVWLTGVADLGMGFPLITHVARAQTVKSEQPAGAFITAATSVTLIPLALGLAGAGLILASGRPHAALYAIAVGAVALNAPLGIANRVWVGLQKTYVTNAWDLSQALLSLGLMALAALAHAGLVALVAAAYFPMLLSNLGSSLGLYLRHPQLRPNQFVTARGVGKTMVREAGMYLALMVAGLLAIGFDNLIALHMLGEPASAVMAVVLRIGLGAMAILDALATPLWPAFAGALALGDKRHIRRLLLIGTTVISGAAVWGAAVIVLFGERLVTLWLGDRLVGSKDVLWALAVWLIVQALGKTASLYFNAASDLMFQVRFALLYGGLAVLAKLALAGFGGDGAILWATTIVYGTIILPVSYRRIRQRSYA